MLVPAYHACFRFHGESHVQCIFLRGILFTVLLVWLVVLYVLVLSVETWKPKLHIQAAVIAAYILIIKGTLPLFSIICLVCHPCWFCYYDINYWSRRKRLTLYAIMFKGTKSKDEFAVSRPLFAACDAARLVAFCACWGSSPCTKQKFQYCYSVPVMNDPSF